MTRVSTNILTLFSARKCKLCEFAGTVFKFFLRENTATTDLYVPGPIGPVQITIGVQVNRWHPPQLKNKNLGIF
jgi:hypothetical protein